MNDSLEDREQVECCHFRGIEIHSSSEVEGPHEKPAPAGVRLERGKFDFIKRVDRGITTVKDLES